MVVMFFKRDSSERIFLLRSKFQNMAMKKRYVIFVEKTDRHEPIA